MHIEKLERVKSFFFFEDYQRDHDYKKFLGNLSAFARDSSFGFNEEDIIELGYYLRNHEKIISYLQNMETFFEKRFKEGSKEAVFKCMLGIFSAFRRIAVFEMVFRPERFKGILLFIQLQFQRLRNKNYPSLLLERIEEEYKALVLREIEGSHYR